MKTTGQILQAARVRSLQDLSEISKITKIREQFLQALESDDYSVLPSGTVARGFIKNYSTFLGLNPDYVLAIFRRDFVENASGQIVPRGMVESVSKVSFWTPKSTIFLFVICIFTLFLGYLFFQYRTLTGPPALKIISPSNGYTTSEDTVEVIGITDPEATISVANQLVALDKGGRFSFRVPLKPGHNTIAVVAIGKSKKTATIERDVNLTTSP